MPEELYELYTCEICGSTDLPDTDVLPYGDDYCCHDCGEICYDCDQVLLKEDMFQAPNGKWYCGDCSNEFTECVECGYWEMSGDNFYFTSNGDALCSGCGHSCTECGTNLRGDDVYYEEDGDDGYCEYCFDKLVDKTPEPFQKLTGGNWYIETKDGSILGSFQSKKEALEEYKNYLE